MNTASPQTKALPKVCIIGAGSSGIATAKVLHQRGIPFDCFEGSDRIGGNWVFENKNEMSACYRHLHINTSRGRMAYSDFPMPEHYPDFCHHSQIAAYFEQYVDHFGFRDQITFETWVEHCELLDDGVWKVELRGPDGNRYARLYDALAVANGHHWNPRWPEPPFPGSFDGVEMHAHAYVDNEPFRGKRVLVLGMGNSAMDIVFEASQVADRTILAARRGANVIPKYAFGRPLDSMPLPPWLPWGIRKRILELMHKVLVGNVENYGLPKPDHKIWEAHPTVSSYVLARVAHGDIAVKPNIAELQGDSVRFVDDSVEPVDIIVYCTGYKVTFPFFDEDLISAPDNDLPLFRRVFKPGIDNLFFIGLLQPLGAVMPLSEAQSEWIADYLLGQYALPKPSKLQADIDAEREAMFERYLASKRHTMQVDFDDYLWKLNKERKKGRKRAKKRDFAAPVERRHHLHGGEPPHASEGLRAAG